MSLETDRQKCAHLLRRFGLGASEAELDYYLQDGLKGAVDRLVEYEATEEGFDSDIELLRSGQNQQVNMPAVVIWWASRMLATRRPLQEKMTLFWHDHFATSASKVAQPFLMHGQNETLRSHATGSFRRMLHEVSKDPAMIFWLDNQENVAGKPNENFAREVMELFTLGIGHYSEEDIQEAARAFTGWAFRRVAGRGRGGRAEFLFRPRLHDSGPKEILGNKAPMSGEDVLNILCDQPRTAQYLTWKVWDWFVYPNPPEGVIEPYAKKFRDANLDIKVLLKAIMNSSDFYSDKAERAVVKNPVDFCVATLRQLGVGEAVANGFKAIGDGQEQNPVRRLGPAVGAVQTMKSMGMWLLYPPDVAGWEGGNSWISSATMVERISWGDRIFGQGRGVRYPVRYPAFTLFQQDRSPEGVVKKLASVFDAPLKPEKLPSLVSAAEKASGGQVTQANANAAAAAVAKLIFATPEFQFA